MGAFAIPRIARLKLTKQYVKERKRNKINLNLIKRINRKIKKNKLTQTLYKPSNILLTKVRKSRANTKTIRNKRETSIPDRGQKIRYNIQTDKIRQMTEDKNKEWIEPFIGMKEKAPIMNIKIDGKTTTCCVDTGASRVMMTTTMAEKLWGKQFNNQLQPYPSYRTVEDAQGQPVTVKGYIESNIEIGEHLKAKYPIIIYEATHSETLLGYSFLVDYNLAIYAGIGLGTQPKLLVKRLNIKEEPMTCSSIEDEIIQGKAMKTIQIKINTPDNWSQADKIKAIGCPIIIHSEDIEKGTPIGNLRCPYLYDIMSIDGTASVIIDNTENINAINITKGEIIAHAEFVEQEATNEQVNKILEEYAYPEENKTFKNSQKGEMKLEEEKEKIGRYDYIDKINIKSNEKGTEEFCKQLLQETENFWSKHAFDIGKYDKKARITLNDTTPVWSKYRPVHPEKETQAQMIIDQLEKYHIIKKGNSPYCSQPVWVWKKPKDKSGKDAIAGELDKNTEKKNLRLCIDYRKINKKISSHCRFPNPTIKDILFKLKQSKYISIIDLTQSYWQIELTEATQRILAFQTAKAMYFWARLPQGTGPSMSIMSQAVEDVLHQGQLRNICEVYVDNIIIFSPNLEQHKKDLKKVIETFMKRGFKANSEKSHLMINTKLRLFGFECDLKNQCIGPDPQKVEAILKIPSPTNQKSARSICGSIGYYSDLIPDLGILMLPIHECTKDNNFNWTEECETNFKIIKKKLAALPVTYLPNFNQNFHLFTDAAAGQYIAWHISQWKEELKKFVPISWGSHKLSQQERSMSQTESEMFAIVYAITQESLLLSFSKIIVHTDCRSLTFMLRFSKICSKINRWQLLLSSYDINICFESSKSIGIMLADILTRRNGTRQKITRRPKPHEIEELPIIKLKEKSIQPFYKIKDHIEREINKLPPLDNEKIKQISEKYIPEITKPEELEGNKIIINKIADSNLKLETFDKQNMKQIFTPEELEYRQDISPSGRLLNYVLQEAPGLSLDALRLHQRNDPIFGEIIKEMIQNKENTKNTNYAMKNGILLKQVKEETSQLSYTICVPKDQALQLIGKYHYSIFGNHPDLKKMMTNIKRRFFIKNLKQSCLEIIKNCQICTLNKSFNIRKQPFGTKIAVTGPREIFCLDICTVDSKAKEIDKNLPTSFLIVVDAWCLYTIAIPINDNATAQEIIELFLKHVVMPFGFPKTGIVTDGGKNFSNKLTNTFSSTFNLQQFRISPHNPKSNVAERINRAILSSLRYAMQQHKLEPEVYKNLLTYVVLSWNTSALSTIGFSPYELFLSTPYEPACLTSFVTLQEAESKDYGDFISALIKTQNFVQNLVNEKYQKIRDKRYQEKAKKSKYSAYSPGTQVMIKKIIDQTQRQHKLKARFTGPYKIIREYENNVEVIPWMENRKTKFIDKYHNEARNIPKHEKYLVSKDRLKPCSDLTFYYDDQLSRAFFQLFWDTIKDVQPIKYVERYAVPNQNIDKIPTHRPSSLLLPIQLGIKDMPIPKHKIVKKHRKSSKRPIKNISDSSSNNDDDDNDQPDNQRQRRENDIRDTRGHNNEQDIIENNINNDNTQNDVYRNLGARPKIFTNPGKIKKSGQLNPWITRKPIEKRGQATIIEGNTGTIIVMPEEREPQAGPSHEPQEIEERTNINQGEYIEDDQQSEKTQGKSTKSRRTRIDPAVQEAISSRNTMFQGEEFERLKQWYQQENVEQAIEEVSQQLEDNYSEMENILSQEENEEDN